jgi:hypothetical protein
METNESDTRRNITPEFFEAVRRGLNSVGDKTNQAVFAKALWTDDRLAFRRPYAREVTNNPNPHKNGASVDGIADTIRRMRGAA